MTDKRVLRGYTSRLDLRNVTAADATTWTPFDEVDMNLHTVDCDSWEDARIAIKEDGGNGVTTAVCFQLLMRVKGCDVVEVDDWIEFPEVCLNTACPSELFLVDGHEISIRVTSITTQNPGASINIFLTGGIRLEDR